MYISLNVNEAKLWQLYKGKEHKQRLQKVNVSRFLRNGILGSLFSEKHVIFTSIF